MQERAISPALEYNFLPIPIFVAGVFIGTFLVYSCLANRLRLLFAVVAALLLLGIATVALTPGAAWLGIIALSLAMGIMNTSVTSVGPQRINLGYVSGTLNSLARHLALAAKKMPLLDATGPQDTHARRAVLLAAIWTAFILGALLAGIATPRYSALSLVFPVVILLGLAAFNPALEPGATEAEGKGGKPGHR